MKNITKGIVYHTSGCSVEFIVTRNTYFGRFYSQSHMDRGYSVFTPSWDNLLNWLNERSEEELAYWSGVR